MSDQKTIQIKTGSTIPTTLKQGEIALNTSNLKLYTSTNGSDIIDIFKESCYYDNINYYSRANTIIPAVNGLYNYFISAGNIPLMTINNPTQSNIWIKIQCAINSTTYFAVDFSVVGSITRREYLQQGQTLELVSLDNYWTVFFSNVSYNKALTVDPISNYIDTNAYYRGSRIKTKQYDISNATTNSWTLIDTGITLSNNTVFSTSGFVFSNDFCVPFSYRNNSVKLQSDGLYYFIDNSIANNNFVNICIEYI